MCSHGEKVSMLPLWLVDAINLHHRPRRLFYPPRQQQRGYTGSAQPGQPSLGRTGQDMSWEPRSQRTGLGNYFMEILDVIVSVRLLFHARLNVSLQKKSRGKKILIGKII